jgi:hypothetical protein
MLVSARLRPICMTGRYNVRRFISAEGTCTVDALADSLAALSPPPSILCLNEVDIVHRTDCLRRVSAILGKYSAARYKCHFFGHVGNRYGNAVLYDSEFFDLVGFEDYHLPGGTMISRTAYHKYLSTASSEQQQVRSLPSPLFC